MLSEEINLLNQGIEQLPDGYYNALAGQLASAYIRQAEATGNPGYQKMPCEPISSWRKRKHHAGSPAEYRNVAISAT